MTEIIRTIGSNSSDFWYHSGIYAVKCQPKNVSTYFDPNIGTSRKPFSYDTMLYVLPEIKLEQVDSVYIGKPGRCMCGCSGNYTYTKANQEWSGKHRGYAVDDEAVNDKRVQYVISKIAKNAAAGIECTQDYIYQQVIGQTQYDIYLKQK